MMSTRIKFLPIYRRIRYTNRIFIYASNYVMQNAECYQFSGSEMQSKCKFFRALNSHFGYRLNSHFGPYFVNGSDGWNKHTVHQCCDHVVMFGRTVFSTRFHGSWTNKFAWFLVAMAMALAEDAMQWNSYRKERYFYFFVLFQTLELNSILRPKIPFYIQKLLLLR